jgi:hypothetical protein
MPSCVRFLAYTTTRVHSLFLMWYAPHGHVGNVHESLHRHVCTKHLGACWTYGSMHVFVSILLPSDVIATGYARCTPPVRSGHSKRVSIHRYVYKTPTHTSLCVQNTNAYLVMYTNTIAYLVMHTNTNAISCDSERAAQGTPFESLRCPAAAAASSVARLRRRDR